MSWPGALARGRQQGFRCAVSVLADLLGLATAIWAVAALTAASGLVVALRMYETHRRMPLAAAGPGALEDSVGRRL